MTETSDDTVETVTVTVLDDDRAVEFTAERGCVLRDALLEHDLSPYTTITERANCGGRGLCATCGVRLDEGPPPDHWHDRLADRFGYPRLSCQVVLDRDVTVRLADKRIWGGRK